MNWYNEHFFKNIQPKTKFFFPKNASKIKTSILSFDNSSENTKTFSEKLRMDFKIYQSVGGENSKMFKIFNSS